MYFQVPTVLGSKTNPEVSGMLSEKKSYHLLLWLCMVLPLHAPDGFPSELPGSLSIYFSPYKLLRRYPAKWKKKLINCSFIER